VRPVVFRVGGLGVGFVSWWQVGAGVIPGRGFGVWVASGLWLLVVPGVPGLRVV